MSSGLPSLPHGSAMPYFRIASPLKNSEMLSESLMLLLLRKMREQYDDELCMEFMAMSDLLANYMFTNNPFIFKVQRFIRHCDKYKVCIPCLLDDCLPKPVVDHRDCKS